MFEEQRTEKSKLFYELAEVILRKRGYDLYDIVEDGPGIARIYHTEGKDWHCDAQAIRIKTASDGEGITHYISRDHYGAVDYTKKSFYEEVEGAQGIFSGLEYLQRLITPKGESK
jgi:hypothetical protein